MTKRRLVGKVITVYSFPERCDMNSENGEHQGIVHNEATKLLSGTATTICRGNTDEWRM